MTATWQELRRARPRARFARWTGVLAVLLGLYAWILGPMDFGDLVSERRLANLERFLQFEVVPPEVRRGEVGWFAWAAERVGGRNGLALARTLGAAILAAALAAAAGAALSLWTSRTALAARTPFASPEVQGLRGLLGRTARLLCVLMRALPEYLIAFLLGAFLPDPAWAAVLALAIHNAGILGRLYGETLENLDQRPARAWAAAGAPRLTAALGAQGPAALPRWLTYFFVRFETCVRESTVLGALGFVSLGHWIVQERAAGRYDEVVLLVAMGAALVVAADLVSWAVRRWIRR